MTNDRKKKAVLKLVNTALVYALLAMAGGVFYREFTKFNGFGCSLESIMQASP